MSWIGLRPNSAIVVRDGRAFDPGVSGESSSVFPRPSTFAGAVAAVYGDFVSCVGPFPCRIAKGSVQLRLPAPRDVFVDRDKQVRAKLLFDAQGSTDLDDVEALLVGRGEVMTGWVSAQTIASYLSGDPKIKYADVPCFSRERRVGLWREDGRTASDSYLYTAENLVFNDDYSLVALLKSSAELPPGDQVTRFGGEARTASVQVLAPALAAQLCDTIVPAVEPVDGKVLVYLATPGVFPHGWRLPTLSQGAKIVAASVSGPESIATIVIGDAGRDGRTRNERRLVHAVAAGSVYYVQFEDNEQARIWSSKAHGKALTIDGDPTFNRLSTAGFNVVLTGRWPGDSTPPASPQSV